MQKPQILWADDEIDLLKPHIMFLDQKGYEITTVNSGRDAIEECRDKYFDLIFLDENMPGLTGLETLSEIKSFRPNVPVVMITKNEEEDIMEEAIGSKITDYLIKPLNPNQILLSIKKILDNKRLVTEKTNIGYQQDFGALSMTLNSNLDFEEWADAYKKLVKWELDIDDTDKGMKDVLDTQKVEANKSFARFIINNYEEWLNDPDIDRPLLSHQLMRKKVFPQVGEQKVFMVVIDNLRYDQWKAIEPYIHNFFNTEEEEFYYSILPTTTAYARNAIFSGMLPTDMAKHHSDIWKGETEEEGRNHHEHTFLERQIQKQKLNITHSYNKILNLNQGKQLLDNFPNLLQNDLNVIVYNFVDMLSHSRTDMQVIKELAPDESAYRTITKSWFAHSNLYELIKLIAEKGHKLIITTDHGTVRVKHPFRIVGDRNTNTNLRYKTGKNLSLKEGRMMISKNPEQVFLPKDRITSTFAFATEDYFFVYPNNYNYYANFYADTFQHGGISMEEMIIPIISLTSRNN